MSLLLEITIDDHDRPPRTYTEDVSSEDEADRIISDYKKGSDFSHATLYETTIIKEY